MPGIIPHVTSRYRLSHGKSRFEPRGISYLFGVIVRVKVVFRKTAVGDWCFDYLSSSHHQSQVKSHRQMIVHVFMPLVVVWIGQFRLPSPGSDDHGKQITGSLPDKPSRVCWDPSPLFIYSIYGHILLGLFRLLLCRSRNNKNIQNINSQKNILCAILEME